VAAKLSWSCTQDSILQETTVPNPIVLTAKDFAPLLANPGMMGGAIDALERGIVALHQGRVRQGAVADETKVNDQPSTLRANLTATDGVPAGLRVAGSAGGVNSGFLMLFDEQSRQLLALMDPAPFGAVRVGAEGGLGARHLAIEGAKTLAMLGSGRQARTQMSAVVAALPGLEKIKVYSPTPEHRVGYANEMAAWLRREIEPVSSVEEAIRDADIVDLVNTAREPIFETSWLKPGALVISITGRGQTPQDFLTQTRMVAPVWEILANNALREPFYSAIKAGGYTKEDYAGDLGSIVAKEGSARNSPADIVDFEATAVPIFDHAIAAWAYQWARTQGVGTEIKLIE
jgi:ornithine cyclodeaminase/alanine dehydrogenase-like protein (mu-crystallin family)